MAYSIQELTLLHESSNSHIYYKAGSVHDEPVIKVLNSKHPTPHQLIRYNNEYEFARDLTVDGVRKALEQIKLDDKPALVMEDGTSAETRNWCCKTNRLNISGDYSHGPSTQ